ncbi:AIR synthase related protein [Alicyclobacillus mengziensis]|uniref:PurM-like N-terminal domain-containing protein n=1 Tax=Alicyclobacillus mengziensis TaxID=2931921 RepID=A0A9X7Z6L4_9BACL|nr:AIR synthase related protein [Alicyclobacillus mengziensis]QSO47507.1 hypothetical protein JZ786_00065 [Alicyclobacillus mengziensis]
MAEWSDFYQRLQQHQSVSNYLIRHRDLTCLRVDEEHFLVIANDSLGGIGSKPLDFVQASPETVGYFALRVPLMEILSVGALPFLIIDNLSVEQEPYGKAILTEIRRIADTLGLEDAVHFNGSTEENVPVAQTGVGITVVGVVKSSRLQGNDSRPGDLLIVGGLPKSAPHHEVTPTDRELISFRDLEVLRADTGVIDMIPVGSKGILYETQELARSAKLQIQLENDVSISLQTSGGPSTCVVFSWRGTDIDHLSEKIETPLTVIGQLKGK